jgi:hypothetical protein
MLSIQLPVPKLALIECIRYKQVSCTVRGGGGQLQISEKQALVIVDKGTKKIYVRNHVELQLIERTHFNMQKKSSLWKTVCTTYRKI